MPVVRISEELFKEVQKHAEPLVDNFETALRKALGLGRNGNTRKSEKAKLRTGGLTPPRDFWRPVLEILINGGGQADAREVVKGVEVKMKNRLTEKDYEENGDGTLKWEKQVNFQRLAMRQEGLIADNSPRGIWAITEQGRCWLSDHRVDDSH